MEKQAWNWFLSLFGFYNSGLNYSSPPVGTFWFTGTFLLGISRLSLLVVVLALS